MKEPLKQYLDRFEEYRDTFTSLLKTTRDLTKLSNHAIDVLTDPDLLHACRYLAAPPISHDDLKTLADTSLNPNVISADRKLAKRIIGIVLLGLDQHRFPWLAPGQRRTATKAERASAILASTALLASRSVENYRRNTGKKLQEERVIKSLEKVGFKRVKARNARTLADAPGAGEFCSESKLGTRKADVIVGLWDKRVMPIECKVSNSALNSIKRLNNDAAVKATSWIKDFGTVSVVPAAVLGGVYGVNHLQDAQARGLTIFWAHRLKAMTDWIESTRP